LAAGTDRDAHEQGDDNSRDPRPAPAPLRLGWRRLGRLRLRNRLRDR
jgi:hypothetical protein